MAEQLQVWRNGRLHRIKSGVTKQDLVDGGYFIRHPGAIVCAATPSVATLNRWCESAVCKAVDGCGQIEPDGHCSHGAPSWLIALGYI